MYHQHIITRGDSETIKKVYYKQKEIDCKCAWFQIITIFCIRGERSWDLKTNVYTKYIKGKVRKAALKGISK